MLIKLTNNNKKYIINKNYKNKIYKDIKFIY